MNNIPKNSALCLSGVENVNGFGIYKRLGHVSFSLLNKLRAQDLVIGLPSIKYVADQIYNECARCKHVKSSFKSKNVVSTSRPFKLVHMYLCGPMHVQSRNGYRYVFILVDDYSRFTWTLFLKFKDETFEEFEVLVKQVQNKINHELASSRSDHGSEFNNASFITYCMEHGVSHNFSAPRTPQQNGMVERKNRILEEMARTMLLESGMSKNFWADAMSTSYYILNRVMLRPILKKTPYELIRGRKPNIEHLRIFGCKCFVHNYGKISLDKFDPRSDEAVFIGYSPHNKAYKVFNKRTLCVEESIHVLFDESDMFSKPMQEEHDEMSEIGMLKFTGADKENTSEPVPAPSQNQESGSGSE